MAKKKKQPQLTQAERIERLELMTAALTAAMRSLLDAVNALGERVYGQRQPRRRKAAK